MMFSHVIAAEMTLQEILDGIMYGGKSSVNTSTDFLSDNGDSYWNIAASTGSFATVVIELAGFADQMTFGVYDTVDPMKQVQLFSGSHSNGNSVQLSIWADGSVLVNSQDTNIDFSSSSFGYYLSTPQNNTFFSDTSLNKDHMDHMLAFQGTGDWIHIPRSIISGVWGANEFILA
jgi:hypothetical protein